MILKHRVQPDDLEVRMFEEVEGALRLRRSVSDASGTQHLERVQKNRPAAQSGQGQRLFGVEPARYCNFGGESHGLIPCICRRPHRELAKLEADKTRPGLSTVQSSRQPRLPLASAPKRCCRTNSFNDEHNT